MLGHIDLDRTINKDDYRIRLPMLQEQLYMLEQALLETRIPVVIVFEGWAGTSKIGTIEVLMRRLDPRGLRVHSITPPRTYELQYPWLQRFWLKIPSYGQIGIFDRSWYREVLASRSEGKRDQAIWMERCDDIVSFERQLADDGTVIIKFWLHISRKEQRHRFKKLLSDPLTAWQVTDDDLWQQEHYKRVRRAIEELIAGTDTPYAPWIILSATDPRYARIAMLETVIRALSNKLGIDLTVSEQTSTADNAGEINDIGGTAIRHHLNLMRRAEDSSRIAPARIALAGNTLSDKWPNRDSLSADETLDHDLHNSHPTTPDSEQTLRQEPFGSLKGASTAVGYATPSILAQVDLSQKIDDAAYERQLARLQAKLHLLGYRLYRQKRTAILVFEGWDAAGKGGAIHRITSEIDPRSYIVHPIAAPSGEDRAHHYLYRFWRRLPPRGQMAIFDRSWYGRVLVERVEGFAHPHEWQRAYTEINEFERQLVAFGTIVCKFWLHISPEEQLRRFEERQSISLKSWKLTAEDWRNREQWKQYETAADEMLLRTATSAAPWTIVESEDKRFGRLKVLRTVVHRLEDELGKVPL